MASSKSIIEGLAKITTLGSVFYNPVQEFNRDLSLTVISTFAKKYIPWKKENKRKEEDIVTAIDEPREAGIKYDDGIYLLEALSATGLRSIRYAKEIPGIKEIVANDISIKAVEDIKRNVEENNVNHLVTPAQNDATLLMYAHKRDNQFDVIDLDPYGCPSIFLDSAIQAVKDGGLLLVTATDMAVLAGNSPETCYSKYGAISLKSKYCHEMSLRILLQCIESHANRYGRYIVPLLSLSADFYVRVFVKVFSGAHKCKFSTSKLSYVFNCTGCDSFELQPLGVLKKNEKNPKNVKFSIPTGPSVNKKCQHCNQSYHMGGPIWSAPLHDPAFVSDVLMSASDKLGTFKRIHGVLSVISEELVDQPLYYVLDKLAGTLHVSTPPVMTIRSAILNAGYKVSFTHMHKTSLKTDAPATVIWDIMRCWQKLNPVSEKRLHENSPAKNILDKQPEKEYDFTHHPDANPASRKMGFLRFQENPLPFWGPGTRSTAMVGDAKMVKSKKNQGKRKREEESPENTEDNLV
ncbi:unnamed protein product [Brassicogethes aeneus]|uniref:tRNA (guanine(26)-N(2))-dimethyltransferase n=1 Tax=Brassicogethes aeneus TaxID=1431903 RepID=A0A9P0BIG2_BRAAE|nr:unnamed protein product [Brassicogethes aeneus]